MWDSFFYIKLHYSHSFTALTASRLASLGNAIEKHFIALLSLLYSLHNNLSMVTRLENHILEEVRNHLRCCCRDC